MGKTRRFLKEIEISGRTGRELASGRGIPTEKDLHRMGSAFKAKLHKKYV